MINSSKIEEVLKSTENLKNKRIIQKMNSQFEGRICHNRISVLPVLFSLHGNVKTYVEIGTLHGGSLALVSKNNIEDSLFVGIDLFKYTNFGEEPRAIDPRGYLVDKEIASRNIKKFNKFNNFVLIKGDSQEDSTKSHLIKTLKQRKIDFLFIDGLHTKEGVYSDFKKYFNLLESGAYIVFDDFDDHAGVKQGVNMILSENLDKLIDVGNFDNEYLVIKK